MDDETLYVAGLVAYDGTDFHGYQYQLGVRSVQGELEHALDQFCERSGRVSAAGRTDTGVHANGQVVSVVVKWRHSVEQLQNAWNAHLPKAIAVRKLQMAPRSFHPRFSALQRTYRYRIVCPSRIEDNWPSRSPLTDRYAWSVDRQLDVEAMQAASDHLVGENDFATFGSPTQGCSTTRVVYEAKWQLVETSLTALHEYPGLRLVFTISANGFLRQMVRSVTSTLVAVGLGRLQPDDMRDLVAARNRGLAERPAPACGLVLERVTYPEQYSFVHAEN